MRKASGLLLVVVAAFVFMTALPAQATICTYVDLAGWLSAAERGDLANSFKSVDIGAGSLVTGFSYTDLQFEALEESRQSELVLLLDNTDYSGYLAMTPSAVAEPGAFNSASGSWSVASGTGAPFTTLDDGLLWVELYELVDNPGVDANVATCTLCISYEPIPEPATAGLILAGSLAFLRRRHHHGI